VIVVSIGAVRFKAFDSRSGEQRSDNAPSSQEAATLGTRLRGRAASYYKCKKRCKTAVAKRDQKINSYNVASYCGCPGVDQCSRAEPPRVMRELSVGDA
jgi:hypothetical protein